MAIRYSLSATVLLLVVMSTASEAQGKSNSSSQGGLPQGKPFQQIQSQLDAVTARISALETQVASLEANLATELAGINASVSALQSWAGTVDGALALIVAQGEASAAAIAALNASIASLESALTSVGADIAALQGQGDAVGALQDEAARLQARIDAHTQQITVLQGQMTSAQSFLTTMAGATCAAGQAIADVGAGGSITCMTPSAGGVQVFAVQRGFAFSEGLHTFTVTCPLGMVTVGGGYDGAFGLTVVGSFPTETSWVVRVDFRPVTPLAFASVQAVAKCVPR